MSGQSAGSAPDELRALLARTGLSQRGAARALDLDEREFRRMCSGGRPVPLVVFLALQSLAAQGAR